MDGDEKIAVSSTDELTVAGGAAADRVRKLGEFSKTNAPLSAATDFRYREMGKKKPAQGWVPRTTQNIGELTPIPESEAILTR